MLDHFLAVAYENDKKTEENVKLAQALKHLPEDTLKKLASGELKMAFGDCDDWIEKYKGTPLFGEALALEKADLANDIARQQASAARAASRAMEDTESSYETSSQIRLQKKMLDLKLLETQEQMAGGSVTPPPDSMQPMTPVPAEAPAPVAPQGPGQAGDASGLTGQKEAAARFQKVAGALKSLATDALVHAIDHPQAAATALGTVAGAGAGAIAGGPDHRLAGAVTGGAAGAALGHVTGGTAGHVLKQTADSIDVPAAFKQYRGDLGVNLRAAADRLTPGK